MARLKLVRDGVVLQTVELQAANSGQARNFVIGRSSDCDLLLNDRAVGREHAVISFGAGGTFVNKKSKFGKLLVNGMEPGDDPVSIQPGDVISIADYLLQFEPTMQLAKPELAQQLVEPQLVGSQAVTPGQPAPEQLASQPIALQQMEPQLMEPQQAELDGKTKVTLEAPLNEGLALESGISIPSPSDKTAVISTGMIQAKLVLAPGAANVEELLIEKSETAIGRGNACELVLNDKSASRRHCLIRKVGAQFILEDLGSGNGTYVNGEKVERHELSGDDVIRVADTEFRFVAGSTEYNQQQGEFIEVDDSDPEAHTAEPPSYDPHSLAAEVTPMGLNALGGGIPGINTGPAKKETLLEKFKRQPKPRKIMIVAALGLAALLLLNSEEEKKPGTKKNAPVAGNKTEGKNALFGALPSEKKQFVTNTYQLAMDLYKNQEYEKSLFEITKVLDILPDGYKDSKDIKRYAEVAIESVRGKLEEKKKKEDKERIEREVAEYVKQLEEAIVKTDEMTARDLFNKIFERDPENAAALRLKQELDDKVMAKKRQENERQELADKKKLLTDLLAEGKRLMKEGKYFEVMERMLDAPTYGCHDEKLLGQAKTMITQARKKIDEKLEPFLSAGKQHLAVKDFPKARDAFNAALVIDEGNEQAKQGLVLIRDTLNEKSKGLFTEGAFAESNGDYDLAKQKYRECLEQAMPDEIYHDRCSRKVKKFNFERSTASTAGYVKPEPVEPGGDPATGDPAGDPATGDPQMPTVPISE